MVSKLLIAAAPAFKQEQRQGGAAMKMRDAMAGGLARDEVMQSRERFATARRDSAARLRGILLAPRRTWPVIAAEPASIPRLYLRYVMPLSAIPPLSKLLGWSLFFPDVGFGQGLAAALLSYICELIGLYVTAAVVVRFVPRFESNASFLRVFKLVAYAATASWVGGIFRLVPVLSMASVLMSLYSVYLLYTGITPMTGVPLDRSIGFLGAVVGIVMLVLLVTGFLIAKLVGPHFIGMV